MRTVLFIEPSDALLDVYKNIMDSLSDYKIIVAKDGMEASQKARLAKFDLICMDFNAPKITGTQLITALRETSFNRPSPILVLSEYIDEVKQKCRVSAVKNVHYLEKPFEKEFLKATITQLTTEGLKGAQKQKFNVTVDFLAAFVDSVKEVFQTMLKAENIKIIPKTKVNFNEVPVAISAQMSMITSTHHIRIVLSMPEQSFLNVLEAMLGEKHTAIDEELKDAIAEVLNILYCHAQKQFLTADLTINKTPPQAVMGPEAWVEARTGRFVPLAISTSLGDIYMGFNVKAV